MLYRPLLEDIFFDLRHGAGTDRLPNWDWETMTAVLGEAAKLVEGEISPLQAQGDAKHAVLEAGRVRLAPEFVDAYGRFKEGGWAGLMVPEEYGGQGLGGVVAGAFSEMLSGACVSFQMVLSLAQGAIKTLLKHGNPAQKELWLPRLASGEWLASMCLTEPQAGSDLGQIKTRAEQKGDSWKISGSKIFISGGDQNLTGKVLHLVLARTSGEGTRGLSLFLAPSHSEDGTPNKVSVLRLEDKMGMHASPTCQMAFEAADAEMIGQEGEGLGRMFTMMNAERLDVAVQAVGLTNAAFQISKAYAEERKQGRNKNGPVTIDQHPDVKRMLLTQEVYARGLRAMVMRTLVELELGVNKELLEFMTPLCKAFATDAVMEVANLGIQVLGGYGYLREYGIEQIFRDSRITPIYEGTNGIQAMTLAARVLRETNGVCGKAFAGDMLESASLARSAGLDKNQMAIEHCLGIWRKVTAYVAHLNDPGFIATAYLRLSGLIALFASLNRLEVGAKQNGSNNNFAELSKFARLWLLPEAEFQAGRIMVWK